ncbi:MAG: hypothetical protein HZA12_03095 [Nitrospirae bacterium]|nr:hypothetical protein [Nitrospirota bacterium]
MVTAVNVNGESTESSEVSATPTASTTGKSWGIPTLIATGGSDPEVAMDDRGNAIVIWRQRDSETTLTYSIWVNRYEMGTGWVTPVRIGGSYPEYHQVSMDGSGNAIVVWRERDGELSTTYSILANRFAVGSGWGTATAIENNANGASDAKPRMAMDDSGNAIVVWEYSASIWANRYEVGNGWGTAEIIDDETVYAAYDPVVAMNNGGNAIAVWQQYQSSGSTVFAKGYVVGAGWGTATQIAYSGYADDFDVAMDSSGNAVAVWDEAEYDIWANRYEAGTSWGDPTLLATSYFDVDKPQVAMDDTGNAIVVWVQEDDIYSKRYEVGTGWGNIINLETSGTTAYDPQVAMDDTGNAIVVWMQGYNIYANHYEVNTGWGTAEKIESNTGSAVDPRLVMDSSGNAVAVWESGDIWANRFESK